MKSLIVILIFVSIVFDTNVSKQNDEAQTRFISQLSNSITGVFQLTPTGSSVIYLAINPDSTFHFITHYDYNGFKSYHPPLTQKSQWTLLNDSTVQLDRRQKPRQFIINSDTKLSGIASSKKKNSVWLKVLWYDENHTITKHLIRPSKNDSIVHYFDSLEHVSTVEEYNGGKLIERVNFYNYKNKDYLEVRKEMLLNNSNQDPVDRAFRSYVFSELYVPIKSRETWVKGIYELEEYMRKDNVMRY